MSISPAPRPLPPLTSLSPGSFYTIVVSGESFAVTQSALEYDAPNFFSEIFFNQVREESATRILYVNRNPDVFRDIVKHMQGYFLAAKDEIHLENLMMDAHFYGFKRLIENLRKTMFINVRGTVFKVSRETVLNDSPNFFAILAPFADRNLTPTFLCRDPEIFKDLLSHLQGYDIHIRDNVHRNNLLKEARYFKLNNLISKLSIGTNIVHSGFPTNPEERIKPEVTMLLKHIKVKHVLVKGMLALAKEKQSNVRAFDGIDSGHDAKRLKRIFEDSALEEGSPTLDNIKGENSSRTSNANSPDTQNMSKEKIQEHNRTLLQSSETQDLLYKPTQDIEPHVLFVELSNIELYAVWTGSVNSSMLGDHHLFVYRDHDLSNLNKICKQLGLQALTMAANVVHLSPHLYFFLDGQAYKGQEDLETIIRKLALSSAKVTPPGRALRLFLGRTLVRMGCKSGQLVMTIVKAEGWSSAKEYNACRKYLREDMKEESVA